VLASGSGSNLQALLDTPEIRPHVAIVISDRPDAPALDRAAAHGVPTETVLWSAHEGRDSFSATVAEVVEESGAKAVVLAGFMRVLGSSFVTRFPNRILNIHPSLLPAFPGRHAVEAALHHGVAISGVTVHIVDEGVDTGPIVAQVPVRVDPDDTVETLHARIQAEEHRIYPEVVTALVQGRIEVVDRKVAMR
jgi:phosphoribosylglycinamide formyltransferase 1